MLVIFGLSGFASLIYQIALTRIFSMSFGSSTYAFSLVVTAFILGIAFGSSIYARFVDRLKDLVLHFSIIEIVIGAFGLILIPILGNLPLYVIDIYINYTSSFAQLQLILFGIIFCIMLVPTFMMGASFPVVAKIYTRELEKVGQSVGKVYAFNTLGAIIGSVFAGFVLLPLIGVQKSLLVAVLINLSIGSLLFFYSRSFPRFVCAVISFAFLAAGTTVSFILPSWSEKVMSSGPYMNVESYREYTQNADISWNDLSQLAEYNTKRTNLIYYKEGINTTVSVTNDSRGNLFLGVNGKTDASNSRDMPTQKLLAHIPLLMHPEPEDVCLIGLGSGITLGSIEQYPVKQIDCVEISPAVVEAAEFFTSFNKNALEDSRLEIIYEDGRNHLSLTDKTYDVIISEPSNPWIAGIGNLFTVEFFETCRSKLKDRGIICIRVQSYNSL